MKPRIILFDKKCCKCKRTLSINSFNKNRTSFSGYNSWCKECTKDYQRNLNYQIKFGITTELYQKMLDEQNGVCCICNRPPKNNRLAVDHDHDTGAIRGLLCPMCNISYEWLINNKCNIDRYRDKQ